VLYFESFIASRFVYVSPNGQRYHGKKNVDVIGGSSDQTCSETQKEIIQTIVHKLGNFANYFSTDIPQVKKQLPIFFQKAISIVGEQMQFKSRHFVKQDGTESKLVAAQTAEHAGVFEHGQVTEGNDDFSQCYQRLRSYLQFDPNSKETKSKKYKRKQIKKMLKNTRKVRKHMADVWKLFFDGVMGLFRLLSSNAIGPREADHVLHDLSGMVDDILISAGDKPLLDEYRQYTGQWKTERKGLDLSGLPGMGKEGDTDTKRIEMVKNYNAYLNEFKAPSTITDSFEKIIFCVLQNYFQ